MLQHQDTFESNGVSEEAIQNMFTKRFQSRSEAAQEIISRQPGFVEKWALILFLFILLFLVTCTWFIRYPDIIEASGTLTADNAPKEIIPLQSGRLIRLFVKNGDQIRKGGTIGWIESTADTKEILELSRNLDSGLSLLQSEDTQDLPLLFQRDYRNLGDIQTLYQSFITSWQQYDDYILNGFYSRKKQMLLRDLTALQAMNATIKQQMKFTLQDKDSAEKSLKMNKRLLDEKVISPEEYRVATSAYINKAMSIPEFNAGILSNQNQQNDKLKELEQLDHDFSQQRIIFEQAMQTLKSSVDDWKHKYILEAPLDGTVFFAEQIQENKFLQQGKLLGYINPGNSQYYFYMTLPQNNLGKADTGMQVQLRFDAYPYQEAGFVKGKIDYISKVASDSGFHATVVLSEGLITNLRNRIQYKNGLRARAVVITKNQGLLQRLYYSIIKATTVGN